MAQHDITIDNQTRTEFRADLNLALAAIASNQSGATAPLNPIAGQLWFDTAAGVLKQRNTANNAWGTIFLLFADDSTADNDEVLPVNKKLLTDAVSSAIADDTAAEDIATGQSGATRIVDAALSTSATNTGRDWVLKRFAKLSAGAVGTPVLAKNNSSSPKTLGNTLSGGSLAITTAAGAPGGGTTLSGTWRCLGRCQGRDSLGATNENRTTLWVRIS